MRLTDLLALSHVPRWSITSHSRAQTVADHTFRVLVIAVELATRVGVQLTVSDLIRLLCHDGHESWSADVPSPMKKEMEESGYDFNTLVAWMKGVPKYSGPNQELIAGLADKIEAYTFISKYGQGEQAKRIGGGCLSTINNLVGTEHPGIKTASLKSAVGSVILDVMEERGRGWSHDQESG